MVLPLTLVGEHGVEGGEAAGAADTAKTGEAELLDFGSVEVAHGAESGRRGEGALGEAAGLGEGLHEGVGLGPGFDFGGLELGDAGTLFRGEADPEVEVHGAAEGFVEVVAEGGGGGGEADDLVEEKAEGAGVVGLLRAGSGVGGLIFDGLDDGVEVFDGNFFVEGAEATVVREELGEGDGGFAGFGEVGPEVGDGLVEREVGGVQRVKGGDGGGSFGGAPDGDEGVGGPGGLVGGVGDAVGEIEDLDAAMMDGDAGAEFVAFAEVAFEFWGEGGKEVGGGGWHFGFECR